MSPEVPHPQRGVRDLVVDRLDLAARMIGPGADGTVRRAAVAHLVTSRLADLWDTAVADLATTEGIALVLKAAMGLRATEEAEVGGIDLAVHGETAYESLGGARVTQEVKA